MGSGATCRYRIKERKTQITLIPFQCPEAFEFSKVSKFRNKSLLLFGAELDYQVIKHLVFVTN